MLQPSTQERFCLVVFVDETKHFSITVKTVGVQIYQELRFTVSQYDKSNEPGDEECNSLQNVQQYLRSQEAYLESSRLSMVELFSENS